MKQKIKLSDYKSYLVSLIHEDRIITVDEFKEEYIENFNKETSKQCVFGTSKDPTITFNIKEKLDDEIENYGYEGQEDFLDFKSPLLIQAQELIDKWMKEQDSYLYMYGDDDNIEIDLTELYEECLTQVNY